MADQQPIAYSVKGFCEAAGIGRTVAYQEMAAGRLQYVKCGRRTLIPADAGREWIKRLGADEAGVNDV